MTITPPNTAVSDRVPDCSPTIRPIVVITPEVAPKNNPVRMPLSINIHSCLVRLSQFQCQRLTPNPHGRDACAVVPDKKTCVIWSGARQ